MLCLHIGGAVQAGNRHAGPGGAGSPRGRGGKKGVQRQKLTTHLLQFSCGHLLPLQFWQLMLRFSSINSTIRLVKAGGVVSLCHLSCEVWDLAHIVRGIVIKGGFGALPLCPSNLACKPVQACSHAPHICFTYQLRQHMTSPSLTSAWSVVITACCVACLSMQAVILGRKARVSVACDNTHSMVTGSVILHCRHKT